MNEPDHTGLPEPCQPIGCDNGVHLPGCTYSLAEEMDELKADVESWQAIANTHLAECLRLEKLVIERTKERDQARAELASARQELDRLRDERQLLADTAREWQRRAEDLSRPATGSQGAAEWVRQPEQAATDG